MSWLQLKAGVTSYSQSILKSALKYPWIRSVLPHQLHQSPSNEDFKLEGMSTNSEKVADKIEKFQCGGCGDLCPEIPYRIVSCGHIFCYLCISTLTIESKFSNKRCVCSVCYVPISEYRRWIGHI